MKILKCIVLLIVFPLILFSPCHSQENTSPNREFNNIGQKVDLVIEDSVVLDDILNISNFKIPNIEKELFYYIDTKQAKIGKYAIENNSTEYIGNNGRGPFEYANPTLIKVKNSMTYIWDASQLKFLVFDASGNGIDESNTLKRSLSDFDVINSDSLALLMSGGFEGPSVGIYSFSKGEIIEESLTGEQTKSDRLLDILEGTGSILAEYPYVYYVLPSSPNIHQYDITSGEEEIIEISSSYFEIDKYDGNVNEFVNNRRSDLYVYLMSNSSSLGLFKHKKYYVLQTINGVASIGSNDFRNTTHENRFYLFYILDSDLNLKGHIHRPYDETQKYEINDNYFYELGIELNSGLYVLNKYNIAI